MSGDYSEVAARRFDELEQSAPDDLWDGWTAKIPRVEAVFPHP